LSAERTTLGSVPYVAPAITADSRDFWTGGEVNELRIYRCRDCRRYIHPPVPVCRYCRSQNVQAEATSGRGTISTFTVNYQQWSDVFDGPYVVCQVQIEEDPAVLITTSIRAGTVEGVVIGAPVEVEFQRVGDAWLPVFRLSS